MNKYVVEYLRLQYFLFWICSPNILGENTYITGKDLYSNYIEYVTKVYPSLSNSIPIFISYRKFLLMIDNLINDKELFLKREYYQSGSIGYSLVPNKLKEESFVYKTINPQREILTD